MPCIKTEYTPKSQPKCGRAILMLRKYQMFCLKLELIESRNCF